MGTGGKKWERFFPSCKAASPLSYPRSGGHNFTVNNFTPITTSQFHDFTSITTSQLHNFTLITTSQFTTIHLSQLHSFTISHISQLHRFTTSHLSQLHSCTTSRLHHILIQDLEVTTITTLFNFITSHIHHTVKY